MNSPRSTQAAPMPAPLAATARITPTARSLRAPWLLGLVLLGLWLALWAWQNPGAVGAAHISAADKARYMHTLQTIPFPPEQRATLIEHVTRWIDRDDGKPVYMLNLMRFNEPLHRFPGDVASFHGSAQESNAIYEAAAKPLLLKIGGYPLYAGEVRERNVLGFAPGLDDWGRVLVVRYPSRKAFLELLTDPAFTQVVAYKLMALDVNLVPSGLELQVPDLGWLSGGLFLAIFLAAGWWRAARRGGRPAR